MEKNEYKCVMCGNTYQFGWSEEDALKEAVGNFGEEMIKHDNMEVVCDDCYQKIKPSEHPEKLAKAKDEFYIKRN